MSGGQELVSAAFNYAALTGNVATAAREAADRIRERIRSQQVAIFDIGRDLAAMKEALGHGQFLPWIEAEFGMNERSAQRFMGVAEALGAKSDTVSHLPPTILYALSAQSTPDPIREEVVQRIESGERLPPDQIKFMVKEAKEAERKAAAEAKLKPAQKQYRKRRERDLAAEEAEWKANRERKTKAARKAVAMIVEALGDDAAIVCALLKEAGGFEFEKALASHV